MIRSQDYLSDLEYLNYNNKLKIKMVKRFRKSRKGYRRSYKKGLYKRKRYGKTKSTKYDGTVYLKCTTLCNIYHVDTHGCSSFTIDWGSEDAPSSGAYARVTQCADFNYFSSLYELYRITGFKYRIIPYIQLNGTNTGYMEGR